MTDEATTLLFDAAREIAKNNSEAAHAKLDALMETVDVDSDPSDVKYLIFGAALAQRLAGKAPETLNLYLQSYDVPQVYLFNLLATHFPIIPLADAAANRFISGSLGGSSKLTIIDIGIGVGRQLHELIVYLHDAGLLPAKIAVAGIDPQPQCLESAQHYLESMAESYGFELTYLPIHNIIEGLTEHQWAELAALPGPKIINAGFALHHIPHHDDRDLRYETLVRLRNLDPEILVVIEPTVDLLVESFNERFKNCWEFYDATFAAIDAAVPSLDDRNALKICFYGREIKDILSGHDQYRSERHETASAWLERLRSAGFSPVPAPAFVAELDTGVLTATGSTGHIDVGFGKAPILSILGVVPDPAVRPPLPDTIPELNIDLPEVFNDLESQIYLAALATIARADSVIELRERAFIDYQAKILNVTNTDFWEVGSLDGLLASKTPISDYTAGVIVRDLIFLASIDEEYHETERAEIRTIAAKLGYNEEIIEEAEEVLTEILPEMLDKSPHWFRKYWYISSKYQM